MDKHTKAWVSPRSYAKLVGVSESTVKRWCDAELVDSIRTAGGHRRIMMTVHQRHARHALLRPPHLHLGRNDQAVLPPAACGEFSNALALKAALLTGNIERGWAAIVLNLARSVHAEMLIDNGLRKAIYGIESELEDQVDAVSTWELALETYEALVQRLVKVLGYGPRRGIPMDSIFGACLPDISPSLYITLDACFAVISQSNATHPILLSLNHWLTECHLRRPAKAWIALTNQACSDEFCNQINLEHWTKVSDCVRLVLFGDQLSDRLICSLPHAFHTTKVSAFLEYLYGPPPVTFPSATQ